MHVFLFLSLLFFSMWKMLRFFFFLRIRKYSRITSNILAFISRILESERFYFELHPKRSETWPFSRAQWAASRMTAAGWHFKFNLNAVLCSTTDAIFPPWWSLREMHQFWALSSPLSHPLSFLITLGPPFFPAPLLSHLRLRRGYLSPPPRCVYFTSKEVSIYTILLHKYWLDFEVHTFYRALSSLASNLPPGILATTQRGSVKSCLISARGNSKSRDGRRDREIWRLIFILREGRFPPCEFSKIGKRICHQLTGGFEISREGKALESWILIED